MDQIILDEFCYVSILYQKGFMECNVRNDVTNRSCRQYLNKFFLQKPIRINIAVSVSLLEKIKFRRFPDKLTLFVTYNQDRGSRFG